MQNAKALIFPSNMNEPFGLVAAEAMACGTPVIATNDGAISEVVEDKTTGFICKSLEEMITAVDKIDLIKTVECRKRVESNFSRQKMAEKYIDIYNMVRRTN
jgi:glycosyltransferase involved in cell wall biosynthesis